MTEPRGNESSDVTRLEPGDGADTAPRVLDENDEETPFELREDVDDLPVSPPDRTLDMIVDLDTELRAVRELLETRLQYDATKEEAFRRLYDDLEQFRGEASFVQMRPLYLDLVLFWDRLHGSLEPWRERSPEMADFLCSLEDEIEELLARQGVLPLAGTESTFDPTLHRVVQVEEAGNADQHNSIARVVRRGYEWNGRLLRAEEVVVRRFANRQEGGGEGE